MRNMLVIEIKLYYCFHEWEVSKTDRPLDARQLASSLLALNAGQAIANDEEGRGWW